MFVFDALMESIMCGDNTIGAPTNVAKERLEELARVNPTTQRSGYESQFQVSVTLIQRSDILQCARCIRNYKKPVHKKQTFSISMLPCLRIGTRIDQ